MTGMIKTNNKVQACSKFIVPFPNEITKIDCGTAYRHQFKDEKAKHEPIPTIEVDNNHNLTPPHHVHYIWAHRKVSRVDLASALIMHRVGIEHFHIHKYMDLCFGGYTDVGYMRRDIKNVVVG
ncbi:hypothetical protein WN943_010529 [Citrus x changshan-huyou]